MVHPPTALRRPGAPPRLARFSVVSLVSTAVTLLAIAGIGDVGALSSAETAALAAACGFACSYPLSRRWVFAGGAQVGHTVALLRLGGLSLAGVVLSAAAGAGVDSLAAGAHLGATAVLAAEETAESLVLGALFVVRFELSRALLDRAPAG